MFSPVRGGLGNAAEQIHRYQGTGGAIGHGCRSADFKSVQRNFLTDDRRQKWAVVKDSEGPSVEEADGWLARS